MQFHNINLYNNNFKMFGILQDINFDADKRFGFFGNFQQQSLLKTSDVSCIIRLYKMFVKGLVSPKLYGLKKIKDNQ